MKTVEYMDELVHINSSHVLVRNFHPNGSDRLVNVEDIEWVHAKRPSIFNGKARFSGTGDFRTWFATDMNRPARDTIFIMKLKRKWWRIGFTVQDSHLAKQVLHELKLLKA